MKTLYLMVVGAVLGGVGVGVGGYSRTPTQYHIQTDKGPDRYFRFQTYTGQYRKEKRLDDGTVFGTYGWVDPNGILRLFDYIADDDGYRIVRQRTMQVEKVNPAAHQHLADRQPWNPQYRPQGQQNQQGQQQQSWEPTKQQNQENKQQSQQPWQQQQGQHNKQQQQQQGQQNQQGQQQNQQGQQQNQQSQQQQQGQQNQQGQQQGQQGQQQQQQGQQQQTQQKTWQQQQQQQQQQQRPWQQQQQKESWQQQYQQGTSHSQAQTGVGYHGMDPADTRDMPWGGTFTINYDLGHQFHVEKLYSDGRRVGRHGYVDPLGILRVSHYRTGTDGQLQQRQESRWVGSRDIFTS